mgnify:CR=1 FL=1|tara:strand:+ start:146 stop:367 length:222 start_codon:yes stop_codon:yes gene_type:complete
MNNTKEGIKNKIVNELMWVDVKPYSHNLVGLYLTQLENKFGEKAVKEVLKENFNDFSINGWDYLLKLYKIKLP